MIEQRPPEAAPVVQGRAEHLPFRSGAFDAALAVLTLHHWSDTQAGLEELARVSARQVVLTWDQAVMDRFWLINDYLPEWAEREAGLATLETVLTCLDVVDVEPLLVPWDCTDGFGGAYWRRPQCYLDPGARAAISGLALCDPTAVSRAMAALARDLESGAWAAHHADLLDAQELDLGYRLVVARGCPTRRGCRGRGARADRSA